MPISDHAETTRLYAAGEYDIADEEDLATDLCEVTDRAASCGHRRIEIDFSSVTLISAGVVATLLRCQRYAAQRGNNLTLTNVIGLPAQVLEITGTRSRLCGVK